jgi:hypothetical protein
MKNHLKIFIVLLTFTSCGSNGTDIRDFTFNEIEFVEMPDEVQEAIRSFYRPTKKLNSNGDTLTHYGMKDESICLDSAVSFCEHKVIWSKLVSSWLDHEELLIDDRKIIIEQSVNVYNGPYVVYNGHLYCRTSLNAEDYKDPSKDEFKVIEINKN